MLVHLQRVHTEEFGALVSKGALAATAAAAAGEGHAQHGHALSRASAELATSDDADDYEQARGKFPDYLNRKVRAAVWQFLVSSTPLIPC